MIYLIVLILLLVLSFHYDFNEKTKNLNFWYLVCWVIFTLIAGLRWRLCVDTPNYIWMFYHEYPTIHDYSMDDFSLGEDPLYVIINVLVKSFGGRFYMVQLIQSAFVNALIFGYIKRHSSFIFLSILFYAVSGYFGYNMDIMRAAMGIVLSLYANDFFLERKWIKGYLLLMVGCLFHAQIIVLLILPILLFLRFNKIGFVVLIAAFFLGRILQSVLLDYTFLFEDNADISGKVTGYLEQDRYGTQGGNMNFYIVHILPSLVYCSLSFIYLRWIKVKSKVLKLEPFLMVGLMFLIMQMSLQIAYRYVDCYRIYLILFLAEGFGTWVKCSNSLSKGTAFIRTVIFFLPYFLFINWSYITHYEWIYPYSSVIERSVDQRRESSYAKWGRPRANDNEY